MPTARALGTVSAVHDYGAGASLEIARDDAPPLLVPFTRACVPEVDVAGRPASSVDAAGRAAGVRPSPAGQCRRWRRLTARMTWRASVLTLFPEMFPGPLAHSLAGRALQTGIWSLHDRQHPRLRHRPASHGGRHAVRRRRRHGAAARRGRCRHRLGRRRPAAGLPDAARPAADAAATCAATPPPPA